MTDNTELKRLAEAHVQKDIADPIESKRVMLVAPVAVLALIAENERLTGCIVQRRAQAEQYDQALIKMAAERDQLKAENEALISALNGILRVTPMGVEAFSIAALVLGELSAAAMGNGEQS